MKDDVKVKMIFGTKEEKLKKLEAFKKEHRILKVSYGEVMIIKYSLGQEQMDDVAEIKDSTPWKF